MKRLLPTLLATVLAVVACGDSQNSEPSADTSRIVTLSGDLTEIVFALGAGEGVVGVDVTTVAPEEALGLPIVGVGRFITAEGVLSVDPTLVIGDTQVSPAEALDQIRAAGAEVELLEAPTSFESLYENIGALGLILGKQAEADQLVKTLADDVETATASAKESDLRIAYLYVRGPDVLLLFGDGMTTRPLIEAAGAVDAGSDSGVVGTVDVSPEGLIKAAPDVIIVPQDGLQILGGVEALLEIPGIEDTPAGRNKAVLAYPEGDFLTFGPRIAETLSTLIEDLDDLDS